MLDIRSDFKDKIEIITPKDGYFYFFGYYDMRATGNGINQRHLCHRVAFMDRLPTAEDVCELGYLENGRFVKFAETRAWNFQQGAMLEYHPTRENTVLYNTVNGGRLVTAIHNVESGEIRYADMPSATHSSDGKYALSVNFGRIYDFRKGYGYPGAVDENADVAVPENDGVFYVDLEGGSSRLLVSYRDLLSESGFKENEKVLVNHITLCPGADKYLMLVRAMRGDGKGWDTSMMVGDLAGGLKTLIHRTYVSHYYWLSPDLIVAHTSIDGDKTRALFTVDAHSGECNAVKSFFFERPSSDIHCSLSPDGRYIIGDGYPKDGYRPILSIDLATGKSKVILEAKSPDPAHPDIRCDLHARFVYNGEYVSFDTTADDGRREVAIFPSEYLKCD